MKRGFLYLAVLTSFALLVLWFFVPGNDALEQPAHDNSYLAEISGHINDIDFVEIVAPGNDTVATLVKSEGGWQVRQLHDYRANWPELRTLLSGFAKAKVVETKTDNPDYYARLGVDDITADDAGGVLVKLGYGDQGTGVLVGFQAQGRPGQYVRLQNEAASALLDQNIRVSTDLLDWVESTIIDINPSDVAEVELIHPDGKRVLVTKISADQTDFDFVGLPAGREIKSSWSVNSLGSVFSMLKMETVEPAGEMDWSDAVKMRVLLFSGVEIMAEAMSDGDQNLLRLSAANPAAAVNNPSQQEDEQPLEQQEIDRQALEDVTRTVMEINQNTSGWVYRISRQKYDALVRKPEDLLKPLDSA